MLASDVTEKTVLDGTETVIIIDGEEGDRTFKSANIGALTAAAATAAAQYRVSIALATYTGGTGLSGIVGTANQSAAVFNEAGNHTDPVVGGDVPNSGIFSYSTAPAGWKWIATLAQAATLANMLDSSQQRAAPYPFHSFDRAGGAMTLHGSTSASGHLIAAGFPGGNSAVIREECLTSIGNFYAGFTDTTAQAAMAPISQVWGTFRWWDVANRVSYQEPVLMFNGGSGPSDISATGKLIHCEFPFGSVVLKVSDGSAGLNLVIPAGTVTERSYRWPGAGDVEMRTNREYLGMMVYTAGATAALDVITVYCPDGRILDYTGETKFRTVMATCYHATFQLVNLTANYAPCGWSSWGIGPNKAATARALGGGASMADVKRGMLGGRWNYFLPRRYVPTAAGWYTLARHRADSVQNLLNFSGKIVSLCNTGYRAALLINVVCEVYNNGSGALTTPRVTFTPLGGTFGGGHVTQWRITTNVGGDIQFDIYVAQFGTLAADSIGFEAEGYLTPVEPPAFAVGATALAGGVYSTSGTFSAGLPRVQVDGGRSPDVEFTTASGDTGWITVATHIAANGSKMLGAGRMIVSATDAAGREDMFTISLSRAQSDNSRKPILKELFSSGNFGSPNKVIDQVRYSLSDTSDTGQLDINLTSRASAATIKVWFEGIFTAASGFATGATVLATIDRSLTLGLTQSNAASTATGAVTLTPGTDNPRQKHVANVGAGSNWTLDDTKASREDWFRIHRPTTGNTGTVTVKDGSAATIGTLAPGEWGRFEIDGSTDKFVMTEKGSGL
jgi:hypothetical protein